MKSKGLSLKVEKVRPDGTSHWVAPSIHEVTGIAKHVPLPKARKPKP